MFSTILLYIRYICYLRIRGTIQCIIIILYYFRSRYTVLFFRYAYYKKNTMCECKPFAFADQRFVLFSSPRGGPDLQRYVIILLYTYLRGKKKIVSVSAAFLTVPYTVYYIVTGTTAAYIGKIILRECTASAGS